MLFEQAGKMLFVVISHLLADFIYPAAMMQQKLFGMLDPDKGEILVKILSDYFFEHIGKIRLADINIFRHFFQGDGFCIMFVDIPLHPQDVGLDIAGQFRSLMRKTLDMFLQKMHDLIQRLELLVFLQNIQYIGISANRTFVKQPQNKVKQLILHFHGIV